ncbi:hypothetical protein KC19_7G022700 [Ceratodon purpureus]|uniref:Uncharacterized protein n=1 Tax=Ceratodon purpureus TaxID=3225 RepID=A0A8T0H5E0_CERPU|nr:hypothetical protein KC19_7G022700 [Ceratodon purpureus]
MLTCANLLESVLAIGTIILCPLLLPESGMLTPAMSTGNQVIFTERSRPLQQRICYSIAHPNYTNPTLSK